MLLKFESTLMLCYLLTFVLSNPFQITVSYDEQSKVTAQEDDIRPAWKSENNNLLVPLHENARTGAVDPITEEGFIAIGSLASIPVTAK
jgi:hypothetical protein